MELIPFDSVDLHDNGGRHDLIPGRYHVDPLQVLSVMEFDFKGKSESCAIITLSDELNMTVADNDKDVAKRINEARRRFGKGLDYIKIRYYLEEITRDASSHIRDESVRASVVTALEALRKEIGL